MFVPKQAITKDVDLYTEITANSTKDVAQKILDLVPQFKANHKILDNGCGAGPVTSVIMAAKPPPDIFIEAMDIDQTYLDQFSNLVEELKWPVRVTKMSSEKLDFADDTFDLSIANFVVFLTPGDGVQAVKEMRRTLRNGGTAVFTSWAKLPHVDVINAAHQKTRDPNGPSLREIPAEWWLGSHLRKVALEAGFDEMKIALHTEKVYITIEDRQRLAQVMWSYLGPTITGWLPSDEEKWDDAIAIITQKFKDTDGFKIQNSSGEMVIELIANVLIART